MMTSKELKEYKNKYLSNFENEREVIISVQIDTLIKLIENQEKLEKENQELKNKYEKLKTKYSNIRKYPAINQALMSYDEIDYEILKDDYGEEVLGND